MASIVELRGLSNAEIEKKLENAREEMFNLRFQLASARLADVSRIRFVRREIAQFQTVLNSRKLAVEAALKQPEIAKALKGKEWTASARFDYEESHWQVAFADEKKKELATAQVDLNKKVRTGRRTRRKASAAS